MLRPYINRAHIAHRLAEDHVGGEPRQCVPVDRDGRHALSLRGRHASVDLCRGERCVETRAGDAGQGPHLGRPVALVRHADQPRRRAQGRHDLGGGREQRNDAHDYAFCEPTRYSVTASTANSANATRFDSVMPPSARKIGTFSASASADPSTPAIAASTMPQIAPPAIRPLEKSTPGPDSISAIDCCAALARRSISQRTMPPTNIADDVEIGRYTPTATGSACTPISSIAIVMNTPSNTSAHGSLCVRMPSVTSAMIVALGESSRGMV